MTRTHIVSLLAIAVAIPAATASALFATSTGARPCFVAGNTGYEVIVGGAADTTVRIDNAAADPSLRLQLVDDPAAADFVLVDDGDAVKACQAVAAIKRVRLDQAASAPDLTVALSRDPAETKIYVRSASFTEQGAAALYAAIWQNARKTTHGSGSGRVYAARR